MGRGRAASCSIPRNRSSARAARGRAGLIGSDRVGRAGHCVGYSRPDLLAGWNTTLCTLHFTLRRSASYRELTALKGPGRNTERPRGKSSPRFQKNRVSILSGNSVLKGAVLIWGNDTEIFLQYMQEIVGMFNE